MLRMEHFLWICAAGAAGTGTRYLVSLWAFARFGATFPAGTLLVNLAGCFLMAVLVDVAVRSHWSDTARLAVTTGYLGGLTTYSSFNFETMALLQAGAVTTAGFYAAATFAGGFAAGLAGLWVARNLLT